MRKYYKYVDETWTQPILYANGTLGGDDFACSASANYGSYYPWKVFDNAPNDGTNGWESNSTNPWFIFYNPDPLKVTQVRIQNFYTSMSNYWTKSGDIYGSNDGINWTNEPLKSFTNSDNTASSWWTIDLSNNNNYYKYYKFTNLVYSAYVLWVEMEITAVYKVPIESTSSDYDFYKDIDVYTSHKGIKRTYYKNIIRSFSQPIPEDNGSIDETDFATFMSSSSNTSYNEPYLAMQNNDSDTWGTWTYKSPPQWWGFWNKNPLKISQIQWYQNNSSYLIQWYDIEASNNTTDGTDGTWTTLYSYTGTTPSARITVAIPNNVQNYYKAYRIKVTKFSNGLGCFIGNVQITALENVITESTTSDYDFYEDTEYLSNPLKRVYYKYNESIWSQPTLTSNGIMGVSSFATSASAVYYGREPYFVFNNTNTTYTHSWETTTANPQWLSFYSEVPLRITNFGIQNASTSDGNAGGHILKTGYIQASNTGRDDDWVNLAPFSNSDTTWGKIWYVNLSSNTVFYHYYRIYIETSNQYPVIQQLYLTGQQCTVVEGTASDYDFYKDFTVLFKK